MLGKNLKLTLLLLTMMLAYGGVKGQFLFSMSYDSLNFPTPSTQSVGSTVRYTFTIHNNGPTAFQDSLYIKIRTNTGTRDLVALDSVSLLAGGTYVVDTVDSVDLARYGGGINILVIWPTAPSPILTDSITDTLIVLTVGQDDPRAFAHPIDVFPIPAQQELFFRLRDPMLSIARTTVQNLSGQTVALYDGLPSQISVAHLPKGLYFILIEDRLGLTSRFKMLKQ